MKKLLLAAVLVFATFVCTPAKADEISTFNWPEKLALYIPNRILDALDSFTVHLGFGPVIQTRVMATRLCDVGLGFGVSCKAYKGYGRQYGFGIEEGWYWSFICVGQERYSMVDGTSLMHKYVEDRLGIPDFTTRTYDFVNGARDYWQFGGSLGLLLDGDLYVHPVEWFDLVLGCFLIDLRGDDLVFDDFR